MSKNKVTVTLEDSDVNHVNKFKNRMGTNFSEALRYIIRSHKFTFGDSIVIPRPDVYERLMKAMED